MSQGASFRSEPERHDDDGWREVWLSASHASAVPSVTDSVMQGHSIVLVSALATDDECHGLLQDAISCQTKQCACTCSAPAPRERLHVPTSLQAPAQAVADGVLQKALAFVDAQLPALAAQIGGEESLRRMHADGRFHFADGEPAVKYALRRRTTQVA